MDHFQHPLVDMALLPPSSQSGDNTLSWDDYELYPVDSELGHSVNDRAAQLHLQFSRMENPPKTYAPEFAHSQSQYAPWSEEPVSAYHSCFPVGMNLGFPPPAPGSDQASSPWSGDLSSVSEGESPRNMNMDYGCYPSPPYSYDEPAMAQPDAVCGGYTADGSGQSVALCQVQQYPDLDLGVKLEPEMMHVSLAPYPAGGMVQSLSQTQTRTQTQTPAHTHTHSHTHTHTPQYEDPDAISEISLNTPSNNVSTPVEIATEPADVSPRPVTSSRRGKAGHRVSKRQAASRGSKTSSKSSASEKNASGRTFTCSFAQYGCPSTFVSKNEWKRHVASQHLQLGFYRCDVGSCNVHVPVKGSKPVANDFNRKDLFTQHQRRMHTPWQRRGKNHWPSEAEKHAFEASLEGVRERCWVQARYPPLRSRCGFCGKMFVGAQSWDERMEHVGRHFEKDEMPLPPEEEDTELTRWAVEEGLVRLVGGSWRLTSLC